jgi:O-antigen/teichoic acid export membrane protein
MIAPTHAPELLLIPLLLILIPLFLAMLAFWIWMIVDCATNEPASNDKIVWLLVIILLHSLGALIYFFARRLNRPKRVVVPPIATPPQL